MIQSRLIEGDDFSIDSNDFYMYYKKVSDSELKSEKSFSKNHKNSLIGILNSLNASEYIDFTKLKMSTNCIQWINSLLLDSNFDSKEMSFLLNDFSDSMNTNMREKDMYVISILTKNKLILAHSRMGEKSINPDFKVFDRMLDKDNVMRFVLFELINNKIKVKHYEKYSSKFFREWLGISKNDSYYLFGGKNKFHLEYENLSFVLEIDDEDFKGLLNNSNFILSDKSITLNNPIKAFNISYISRSRSKYENYSQFKMDYVARSFDFKFYQNEYKKLDESLLPALYKFYDCISEVRCSNKEFSITKSNNNLNILFVNEKIDISDDFLERIVIALENNNEFKIAHAGLDIIETPISIGNFHIYNSLDLTLAEPLINYYNYNEFSDSLKKELICTIFSCLIYDSKDNVLYYFFKKLFNYYLDNLKLNDSTIIYENDLIELKASAFINGNNKFIIKNLSEDISKKFSSSNYKLYILGYDEKTKKYEPVSSNKFDDSRLDDLTKTLKKETGLNNLNFTKINLNKDKCILLLSVMK